MQRVKNIRELKGRVQADVVLGLDDRKLSVTSRIEVPVLNKEISDLMNELRRAILRLAEDQVRQALANGYYGDRGTE